MSDGFLGRKLILKWNGAKIGGCREKSVALNGEGVDLTDDDDDGWRVLLEEDEGTNDAGENTVEISVSGVTKSGVLMDDWFAFRRTGAVRLEYPNGRIIAGTFRLASYTDTGPYKDATTFEATFQSSGVATSTPPA